MLVNAKNGTFELDPEIGIGVLLSTVIGHLHGRGGPSADDIFELVSVAKEFDTSEGHYCPRTEFAELLSEWLPEFTPRDLERLLEAENKDETFFYPFLPDGIECVFDSQSLSNEQLEVVVRYPRVVCFEDTIWAAELTRFSEFLEGVEAPTVDVVRWMRTTAAQGLDL